MKTRTISITLLLIAVVLSACSGLAPTTSTVPTTAPTTIPPTAPTQTPADNAGQGTTVTVDVSGVAQSTTSQVIAAVPASTDNAWWAVMPEYTQLTLAGYVVTKSVREPQIFVYPVNGLMTVNTNAAQNVTSLNTLLQTQQAGEELPFLPLPFSESQVRHAQVKYLDFKTGQGVRYLTQFGNGMGSINNRSLLYTFQGLTNDGKYYVAVVLPVNLAGLPADESAPGALPTDFPNNYVKYLDDTFSMIDQQPGNAFTPDLSKLDALVQSIEIK